jgi:hypothetical protein
MRPALLIEDARRLGRQPVDPPVAETGKRRLEMAAKGENSPNVRPETPMTVLAPLLLGGAAVYALAGIVVALAFVTMGLAAVLPGTPVTIGARILFIPGAAVLWPVVLRRWLQASRAR